MGETADGDAPTNIEGRIRALLTDPTLMCVCPHAAPQPTVHPTSTTMTATIDTLPHTHTHTHTHTPQGQQRMRYHHGPQGAC
jgi:hypothetical protein